VQNFNEFKKIWGFGGLVKEAGSTDTVEGAQIIIKDPDGNVISQEPQTGVVLIGDELRTDEDGFYTLSWKHKGKEATYTVELVPPAGWDCVGDCVVDDVSLGKGVKFAELNFDITAVTPTP
jgi:hypothetical protein